MQPFYGTRVSRSFFLQGCLENYCFTLNTYYFFESDELSVFQFFQSFVSIYCIYEDFLIKSPIGIIKNRNYCSSFSCAVFEAFKYIVFGGRLSSRYFKLFPVPQSFGVPKSIGCSWFCFQNDSMPSPKPCVLNVFFIYATSFVEMVVNVCGFQSSGIPVEFHILVFGILE